MRLIASGMGGFDTCEPFDAAFDKALVGEVSGLAALLVDVVGSVAGFGSWFRQAVVRLLRP